MEEFSVSEQLPAEMEYNPTAVYEINNILYWYIVCTEYMYEAISITCTYMYVTKQTLSACY